MVNGVVNRVILALLLAVFATVVFVAADKPSARQASELPPMPWSSIVLISDGTGYCTGFVVGRGLIATAGHCGDDNGPLSRVRYVDGTIVPFKLLARREKRDCFSEEWTLLMANTFKHRPFQFADAPAHSGDEIWHAGHPNSILPEVLVLGRVTSTLDTALLIEGVAIPGESGSPVVNRDGQVVGIVNCSSAQFDATIANKVTSLQSFLIKFGAQ